MDYLVRRSARARHVWLKVSSGGGLVVVLPCGYGEEKVPGIIERYRAWIERTAKRVASRRAAEENGTPGALPGLIALDVLGQPWTVDFRTASGSRVTAREQPGQRLVLCGDTANRDACREALLRWLQRKAKAVLEPRLRELAEEGGFSVARVVVRLQRTRWGSCSRRGSVSLNARLLFVAPELARHVMLHELCHTVRMDHSKEFWELLARHDPEWRAHRRRLLVAWRDVPAWLHDSVRL